MKWLHNTCYYSGDKRWEGKIIGEPRATAAYTVEQLEAMGMVGVYEPETEPEIIVEQ